MIFYKRLLTGLFFFITFFLNAQLKEKFEKGRLITKDSITLEGYILAQDLSNMSHNVCFKQSLERKCIDYSTNEVVSYQMDNGTTFHLLNLKINNNQTNYTVFSNLILKGGAVSLYKSTYKSDVFYIISKNGEYYVLQKDKLIFGDSKVTRYNFKGIINAATDGMALRDNLDIAFDESVFIDIISKYNATVQVESTDLRVGGDKEKFLMLNLNMGFDKTGVEFYGQFITRFYYPKISRNTSLNTGLGYSYYNRNEFNIIENVSILSVPLYIQHNILNKNIRPNVFVGASISYISVTDASGNSLVKEGLQQSFGLSLIYGVGIEVDVYKGIYLKGEYRNEFYLHPFLFGLGYIF